MSDNNLSFTRNLKDFCWGETVRLNLLRALGAGIAWAIFTYGLGASWTVVVAIAPLFPIVHLFIGLPIGVAAHALTESGFPIGKRVGFLIAVLMLPGDPFVFFASRIFRRAIPTQGVSLFNLTPVLLVSRALSADGVAKQYEVSSISGISGFVE